MLGSGARAVGPAARADATRHARVGRDPVDVGGEDVTLPGRNAAHAPSAGLRRPLGNRDGRAHERTLAEPEAALGLRDCAGQGACCRVRRPSRCSFSRAHRLTAEHDRLVRAALAANVRGRRRGRRRAAPRLFGCEGLSRKKRLGSHSYARWPRSPRRRARPITFSFVCRRAKASVLSPRSSLPRSVCQSRSMPAVAYSGSRRHWSSGMDGARRNHCLACNGGG